MTTIIKNPRITEKASVAYEKNVYSFNVSESANKTEVKKAIFSLYKVKPLKVNILSVPRMNFIKFRASSRQYPHRKAETG